MNFTALASLITFSHMIIIFCKSKELYLPNKPVSAALRSPPAIKNTFHKSERLCSKKQIDLLFSKGNSETSYPLKIIYLDQPSTESRFPAQAMFVVPKRNFKRAHDRNLLKRRMREAYRLNKADFYETLRLKGNHRLIAFLYISKKEESYAGIFSSALKLLTAAAKTK
jgi:ribonuclease P protein component